MSTALVAVPFCPPWQLSQGLRAGAAFALNSASAEQGPVAPPPAPPTPAIGSMIAIVSKASDNLPPTTQLVSTTEPGPSGATVPGSIDWTTLEKLSTGSGSPSGMPAGRSEEHTAELQ